MSINVYQELPLFCSAVQLAKPCVNHRSIELCVVETKHMFDLANLLWLAHTTIVYFCDSIQSKLVSKPVFPLAPHPVL